MKPVAAFIRRSVFRTAPVKFLTCLAAMILVPTLTTLTAQQLLAQNSPSEKAFPQSKANIEKALKTLQPNLAGHLPALEGFAQPTDHALDRYQRAFYQATVQVSTTPSGGSLVRVNAKITAWYNDPAATHSGYQLLPSNGRLESDVLDQLSEQLARISTDNQGRIEAALAPAQPTGAASANNLKIAAPAATISATQGPFSSRNPSLAETARASAPSAAEPASDPAAAKLKAEADSLEGTLKNQIYPKNLVAVRKSGTPVVATPSLNAKPQFLASMHDEFEMLDFNADWVHVRISGLSRGWIWRNSVEMPEGIPDTEVHAASSQSPAADLFHVVREQTAPFPGDWEPLRGKNVKILSVQKFTDAAKDAGPREKLEYTKFLLTQNYSELATKPDALAGLVVIFDSADGGMIAATLDALQRWRAGTLSDAALWHQCFFDPPETFDSTASAGSK